MTEDRASPVNSDVFVETHVHSSKFHSAVEHDLDKAGWKCSSTGSTPTGRGGSAGGELVTVRKHLAATTFQSIRQLTIAGGRADPCKGFAAMVLHLSSGNLVLIALYLQPGLGTGGRNSQILAAVASFVGSLADAWVILGDWNQDPSSLTKSGWPAKLGGELLLPSNCSTTCDKAAEGTLIDYGLVKLGTLSNYCLRGFFDVP